MHTVLSPMIHFLGTPVVPITSVNQDGLVNLAPASSVWWLGLSGALGLGTRGQTYASLARRGGSAFNAPSANEVPAVDRLALTTGADLVPEHKRVMGSRFVRYKYAEAGVTAAPSDLVRAPRVGECAIKPGGRVTAVHATGPVDDHAACPEVPMLRVHADQGLLEPGHRHRVAPDGWCPLVTRFLEFYGLGERVRPSRLAEVF